MMAEPKVYKGKLKDFKPDQRNLNRHTQRGRGMVEASQRQRGFGRPGFAAKDKTILGGNLSIMEVAPDIGLGDGDVFVVETDGDIPIVHLRRDIEPGTEEAVLLAAEDNQSALVSIDFDPERLAEEIAQGVDFGGVFTEDEIERYTGIEVENPYDEWGGMPEFEQEDKTAFQSIHIHFKDQEAVDQFASLIEQKITNKTRSLWYPEIEIERYADKRYTT